jgi:hypothetical protein
LKRCTVRLKDGFSATALVNDTPVNGDTSVDIDNVSNQNISPGTRFTFESIDREYHVTAVTRNEVQSLTVDATDGNFTITFDGQTTANIDYDTGALTAATIQSALEALSNIAPGDVSVSGAAGGPYLVEFMGTYAGTNVAAMTTTDVDLSGGGTDVVVATVNAGGNVNRITFTPAIATADGIPNNNDDVTFTAHTLTIKVGDGEVNYEETVNREYELDRGELDDVVDGDDEPMTVNLSMKWEEIAAITGAETPTPEDVLKQRGPAADWVSTDSDTCRPYAIDIEITHTPRCAGGYIERVTLPDFRYEGAPHNYNDGTLNITGRCNATEAVVERIEQ